MTTCLNFPDEFREVLIVRDGVNRQVWLQELSDGVFQVFPETVQRRLDHILHQPSFGVCIADLRQELVESDCRGLVNKLNEVLSDGLPWLALLTEQIANYHRVLFQKCQRIEDLFLDCGDQVYSHMFPGAHEPDTCPSRP